MDNRSNLVSPVYFLYFVVWFMIFYLRSSAFIGGSNCFRI